jgi:hypothetical protein
VAAAINFNDQAQSFDIKIDNVISNNTLTVKVYFVEQAFMHLLPE